MVIVAAIDRTDRAETVIEEGEELATAFGEELHVVHVVDKSDVQDLQLQSFERTGEAIELDKLKDAGEQYAEKLASDIDLPYTAVGLFGDAAAEVINYSNRENANYIISGPKKQSPAGKAIFGSVAQSIMLESQCPVIIVSA